MHGLIVNVGGDGVLPVGRYSVGLLLVANEMLRLDQCDAWPGLSCLTNLGTGNDPNRLNPLDGLEGEYTAEPRVHGKSFPVATALDDTADRPYNGPESNIDSFSPKLQSHVDSSLPGKSFIPTRPNMYAAWPPTDEIGRPQPIAGIA